MSFCLISIFYFSIFLNNIIKKFGINEPVLRIYKHYRLYPNIYWIILKKKTFIGKEYWQVEHYEYSFVKTINDSNFVHFNTPINPSFILMQLMLL